MGVTNIQSIAYGAHNFKKRKENDPHREKKSFTFYSKVKNVRNPESQTTTEDGKGTNRLVKMLSVQRSESLEPKIKTE